jgi:serine/threonine-protein kinase
MAEAGRAYGTPYYISPEQIRGEVNIDHRADIYSLGATFYHMVTGRVPFEGPTPSAVMHKHLREPLTPPDHVNTRLTAGCAAMIEMMMAKKRDQRYPSCKEILSDLDLLARGQQPHYAKPAVGHDVFSSLAKGEAMAPPEPAAAAPAAGSSSSTAAVVLGICLAISVLVNIILAVFVAG